MYSSTFRLMVSTLCVSRLAQLWRWNASQCSLDFSLWGYIRTQLCNNSMFAWSWPIPMHLQPVLITASEPIFMFILLQPSSVSPILFSYYLLVNSILSSPCAFPNPLSHGLRVYLWFHSMITFRHTSNCFQAPPAASPYIPCVDG